MITLNGEVTALYKDMSVEQLTQLLTFKEWQLRSHYTDFPQRKSDHICIIKQIIKGTPK